jgi:hypothetical protein
MTRTLTLPVVCVAALVLLASGCNQEQIGEQTIALVRDGKKVADVTETVRKSRVRGELVQHRIILVDAPGDAVLMLATLDAQGFATGASYRREGKKGKRYVELTDQPKEGPDRRRVIFSRGDDETMALPDKPIVLLDLRHRLHAQPNQDVVVVDIENAVARMGRIDERGQLVMPGPAPKPGAGDEPLPAHKQRAPFLESKTALVSTWCRGQALGDPALGAAHKLALATKPKLDAERAGGPPSALMAVQIGGGDETGAALVVACLRALDHPARVVSGRVAGDEALRTWAQVHDGARWVDVDPLDIDLAGAQAHAHDALVEGFRGPLTTGLISP